MPDSTTITAEEFSRFAIRVFQSAGLPKEQAQQAVAPLVWASLRGVDTHGIRNFKPYYIDGLVEGRIAAKANCAVEFETPVSARANGADGLGLSAAAWGMQLAIDKAATSGIGLVSMRNSNHLGAAGFFSQLAVEHNMLGLCLSGHLYGEGNPTGVPPVFGLQPMFGTNPLSVAIPCGDQPTYVLDMSTSVVPVNRVEMMQEQGQSIPQGWCLDATGRPTTDPAQAAIFLPLGGTRELGGHKGFGLATVVEVLTALLSQGWAPTNATPDTTERPAFHQDRIAHFFGAIRIDLFCEANQFRQAMDAMIDSLHRAQPAPGHERIFVPGEIEHETERARRQQGIPLSTKEVDDLVWLSEHYNVPLALSHG